MSFERWGSLSVSDHTDTRLLVANVLMYDRLVWPVFTDADDRDEHAYWVDKGWDPGLQLRRLEQLGPLAVHKPWNRQRRETFVKRLDELKELQQDAAAIDTFGLTRRLLAQEQQVDLPPGVTRVDILAAYNSAQGIKADFSVENKSDNHALQAYLVARKLAVPAIPNADDALQCAIDLSKDPEFRKKRGDLFDWQDYVIQKGYTPQQAVDYMAQLTDEYNQLVRKAYNVVSWRFAFTIGGIALGLIGAGLGQPIAGGAAILALIEFATLDREPVIEAGDTKPMAMFHDIEARVGVQF